MSEPDRHVTFEAGFNCRDLGGYETKDGRRVRWGTLYRSGSLHRLTTMDLALARKLGLRTVIDLRSTGEVERTGRFSGDHVAVHHVPLYEDRTRPFDWAKPDDPEPSPGEDYVAIAETGAPSLARALCVIASGEHPVLFHCVAGKDRTGILAALLFCALRVSDATIMDDYELSNLSLGPYFAWATENDPEEAAVRSAFPAWLLRSSRSTIQGFLEAIRLEYGSIDRYLARLGVNDDVLRSLRMRLLEA